MKALLAAAVLVLTPAVAVAKPPTVPQAKHAIRNSPYLNERISDCKIVGKNISCTVSDAGCFDDNVFGPSLDVATTIVGVGPRLHVWAIVPTKTEIFAGYCPTPGVGY